MLVKIRIRSMSTSIGFKRNGDVVDLPEDEVKKIISLRPEAVEIMPQPKAEAPKAVVKKAAPKRKRARTDAGKFQADDPATPDVNEAWVKVK